MFGRALRAGFRASSLRGRPLRVGEKGQPALFRFIDTLSSDQVAEYTLPSLATSVSGLGTPFGPSPEATAGPFDWLCYMPYDPTTKQIILAGGRAASIANATKVMIFDAEQDLAYSYKNPFGVGTGHIYQGLAIAEGPRRLIYRGFNTGALFLWDIDAETSPGTLTAFPSSYRMGENPAFAWFPDWGTQGSLVVVGRDVDTNGIIQGRYDWALAAWQSPVYLAGPVASTWSNDHPAGCYVPAASAGIFGMSYYPSDLRQLLVVPSGGATPYWTADVCPGGVSVVPSDGLITPHPTRAAAVIISRDNLRAYTYEFASDTYVDRVAANSIYGTVNQGITTIAEKGALVSLHGAGGTENADEMWVWKVGSSLG